MKREEYKAYEQEIQSLITENEIELNRINHSMGKVAAED